jgi:hypothetical protein
MRAVPASRDTQIRKSGLGFCVTALIVALGDSDDCAGARRSEMVFADVAAERRRRNAAIDRVLE